MDIEVGWWIADLRADHTQLNRLEEGIESTRSEIHLNSVFTICVVCTRDRKRIELSNNSIRFDSIQSN